VALLDTATGGALLVIDADHFKMVNDYFGHDCGDEALQLMARTIKASVRDGDLVGRIGGEEFGVFLKEASLDNATMTAERIRRSVATASFTPDGTDHQLSVSIGGAHFDSRISFTDLFRIADQRLYEAKQSGRNTAQLARASDHEGTRPTRRPTPINWAEAG
jgi:diguanylate cyclase